MKQPWSGPTWNNLNLKQFKFSNHLLQCIWSSEKNYYKLNFSTTTQKIEECLIEIRFEWLFTHDNSKLHKQKFSAALFQRTKELTQNVELKNYSIILIGWILFPGNKWSSGCHRKFHYFCTDDLRYLEIFFRIYTMNQLFLSDLIKLILIPFSWIKNRG